MRKRYDTDKGPRIRHDKRTIPLHGIDEDDGKYFECWWCGFINDKDEAKLGGPHDKHGVVLTVDEDDTPYPDTARPESLTIGLGGSMTLPQSDPDGDPIVTPITYNVTAGSGCGFCGSRNYR